MRTTVGLPGRQLTMSEKTSLCASRCAVLVWRALSITGTSESVALSSTTTSVAYQGSQLVSWRLCTLHAEHNFSILSSTADPPAIDIQPPALSTASHQRPSTQHRKVRLK